MNERTVIGFDAKRIVANASGLGNYSRTLINSLIAKIDDDNKNLKNKDSFSFYLYTPKYGREDLRKQVTNSALLTYHYPTTKLKNLWREKLIVKDLLQDRVALYHGLSGELPLGIHKNGIKSIVTIHDLIFLTHPEFYKFFDRKIYAFKFFQTIKQADRIVAISECTKKDIIRFGKISEDKISVIYQPCSKRFSDDICVEQLQKVYKKYALPDDFILNVGSIERRKNILLCVKAIVNEPYINLVIVGKRTSYTKEIEDYIAKNNMEQRVKIFHNVTNEELPCFYRLAKFFVYPSVYEGFGLPIIEAVQMNKAVIAAKGSCLEEAGGKDNIYVNPYDVQDCKEAIKELWNNNEKRTYITGKSKDYIKKFENTNIAGNYLTLYSKILAQK